MKYVSRVLSLLLCLLMLLSLLPTVFADEEAAAEETDPAAEPEITEEAEAPAFVRYGLDKRLRKIGGTEEYRTCGYKNGKSDANYTAKAEVKSRWAVFYKKDTDREAIDMTRFYIPEGAKIRYVEFNNTQMKAARRVEEMAGDGYEWRGLDLRISYTSFSHGYSTKLCLEDYYDVVGHDETGEWIDGENSSKSSWWIYSYKTEYEGEQRDVYMLYVSKGDGKGSVRYEVFFYTPEGYDGCVAGVYDGRKGPDGWAEGTYVFDYQNKYMLLYRLK